MCGICGLIGEPRPAVVAEMLRRLEHRGPDDEGIYESPHATLGARRLAIIDVAGGHQPALNEDESVAAVLNGEIYNYRELRELLARRGHRFRSASDTEILPHLYEEFGTGMLPLLRGMFAVAVWDERERRLLLARDRAGEKPLYYARTPSGLVFGSELKAVLAHPDVSRDLDPAALKLYLQLQYVPGEQTTVASVRKLRPGHRAVFEHGALTVSSYWDVVPGTPAHFRSRPGAVTELRDRLEEAVSLQMHADRPVGALLSGGIDSIGVVAMMKRAAKGETVRTFTVGFDDPRFDERTVARRVAEELGTEHTELVVGPPSFDDLERLVYHLDEPLGDQAALPMYLIARVASEHVTVVLTGEGSDELFGGYERYGWFQLAGRLDALPPIVHDSLRGAGTAVGRRSGRAREADLLLTRRAAVERQLAWTGVFAATEADELLLPELRRDASAEHVLRGLAAEWSDRPAVEQAMLVDLKSWLVDDILTKADRTTMAWSIESRAPYLDHQLVDFAVTLPATERLRGRLTKGLLREALRGLVPASALNRPKHAFRVPVEHWLGSAFADDVRALLLDPDAHIRSLLDERALRNVLAKRGREAGRQIWTVAMLELWLRTVLYERVTAHA